MASESRASAQYIPAFGYGSNLWDEQMKKRCPDNVYAGIAKLDGWKWIINSRKVATVIPSPADHVWGTVLLLHAHDEKTLDDNEGPRYDKRYLPVDIQGVKQNPRFVLIYIDKNGESGIPSASYATRLKNAKKDGLAKGIPQAYFDKYWLPFLLPANPGIYTMSEIHPPSASPLLLTRDAGVVTMRYPYFVLGPEQQWRITPGEKDENITIKSSPEHAQPSAYLTYNGTPGKPKEGDRVGLQDSNSPTDYEWRVKVSPGGNHFIYLAGSDLGIKYIPANQDSPDLVLSLRDQVEWTIRLNHADQSNAGFE